MLKNILLSLLMFTVDMLLTAVVQVASGSSAPKKLIEGLVLQVAESDEPSAVKLANAKALIEEAAKDFRGDLNKLPTTLRNLVIETAVTRLKAKVGKLAT